MNNYLKTDECWYKDTCNHYDTEKCNNCIRFLEMSYLMTSSNIPKSNQFKNELIPTRIDLDNFKFLNNIKTNIVDFVNNGNNLYIYSKNFGNGKTSWSIKIMQKYFNDIWPGNGFKERGIFIHVPTFLTKFKEVMNKKDDNFEIMKKKLTDIDLVIWDDIASVKLSDFDHTNLLTYIDTRKLNGKANIYTGNLYEDELIDALGNRLKSRVWNDSIIVELKGSDMRGGLK